MHIMNDYVRHQLKPNVHDDTVNQLLRFQNVNYITTKETATNDPDVSV